MNKDDRWLAKHFGQLVDHYGGRYVAVVNRRVVAAGRRPEEVEALARLQTGAEQPSVVRVPRKDLLRSAL